MLTKGAHIDPASKGINRQQLMRKFASAYVASGGQVGIGSSEGNWRLSVIADNLTNERIRVIGGTLPLARTFVQLASGGALDGTAYDAIYARPRNITFKLDYNF